ncbi:hypothetical protein [Halorussus rarus]|uniref:hypothetical protein n=1 Tax=Halorussus TaxID=1070314 RepID=UPI001F04D9C7|nr:hypothetical protein [Halorussus rarus]
MEEEPQRDFPVLRQFLVLVQFLEVVSKSVEGRSSFGTCVFLDRSRSVEERHEDACNRVREKFSLDTWVPVVFGDINSSVQECTLDPLYASFDCRMASSAGPV